MEEQEVPPENERYKSVPRESLQRQSSRRPSPMDRNIAGLARQTTSSPNDFKREESSHHPSRMFLINEDLFRQLNQDIHALKDRPRFTGEGEYNHLEWIRWIDYLQKKMHCPDSLIISKLPMILAGLAEIWFDEECHDNDFSTWEE